jgi:hypothetical protein
MHPILQEFSGMGSCNWMRGRLTALRGNGRDLIDRTGFWGEDCKGRQVRREGDGEG